MPFRSIQEVENVINIIQIQHVRHFLRNRRTFKTRNNPFHLYSDEEFRLKYRFSKHGVNFLNRLFGSAIAMDKRGGSLSPMLQILIALRYWGHNQIQDDAADIHGLSQQSISRISKRVAKAILDKRFDYNIKMPNSINEQLKTIQEFEALADFKTVIGAIDCTHIRIPKVQGPSGQFSQLVLRSLLTVAILM